MIKSYWDHVKLVMLSGPKVTVVLQRRSRVPDLRGGSYDVWNDIESFKAVLSPIRMNPDKLAYTKETIESDHVLYCKVISTTATIYDRIDYTGRKFQIKSIHSPVTNPKLMKIGLLELK